MDIPASMITHGAWIRNDKYKWGVDLYLGKDNTLVTHPIKEKTMKKYIMFVPNPEKSIEVQDRLIAAGFKLIGDYRENSNFLEIDDGQIFHISAFQTAARKIKGGHIPLDYNNFDAFALDGAKKMIEVKGKEYTEDQLQEIIEKFNIWKYRDTDLSICNSNVLRLKKTNKEIVLRLKKTNKEIALEVIDDKGRFISNILGITNDGYLELYGCVDFCLGLELDNNYKIKIKD